MPDNKKLVAPFKITSICRGDLEHILPQEALETITDAEMDHIASKMADDYLVQLFWSSLEIIAGDYVLEDLKRECDQVRDTPKDELPLLLADLETEGAKRYLEERMKNDA